MTATADSTTSTVAAPCPVCGSYTGTTLGQSSALLAVCDVLTVRALEAVGKRIVRADRSRYARFSSRFGGRPWHLAHTLWTPDDQMIEKAIAGAWDVVPAMLHSHGCCGVTARQVTTMLDGYVRDLLVTGTEHNMEDLHYRFRAYLGIDLPAPPAAYDPGASHAH